MKRRIALALAIGLVAVGAMFYGFQKQRTVAGSGIVTLTEALADGQIYATITPLGDLAYQVDVRLSPAPDAADLRPEANFAMVEMHMDGIIPVFSNISPGVWQAKAVLPMAGAWVINIGFGEDFAETTFEAG